MLFFILSFILAWLLWFLFADKKRWRELLPVGIFAGFLGTTSDVVTKYYYFWDYHDPNGMHSVVIDLVDDWGLFIVATFLFIQWLPKKRTFWKMFGYWFIWTGFSIALEWFYVVTHHMNHYNGWNYLHSYLSDWFLLWVFYQFNKHFRLDLLGIGMERFGDILFVLDKEARLVFCSSQWLKKKGIDSHEYIGKSVYEIDEVCKEEKDKYKHERFYKRVLNGEHLMFEWEMCIHDKTYCFETFLSPMFDKNGKITGIMGIDYEKKTPSENVTRETCLDQRKHHPFPNLNKV